MGSRHLRRRLQGTATLVVALADAMAQATLPESADGQAAAADTGPKWVQVTREGTFPGYAGGTLPFTFTRADLDKMVANIRRNPAYKLDAAGNPIGKVIPWDYNHASEMDPTSGELPVAGAPAQGWTLDLEVRNGPDGKAQLWALTEFIEPARTYVKAGQYQWASVSVVLNAVDQTSGLNVGPTVTSIALTNTPFIEGMEPLVASRTAQTVQMTGTRGHVYAARTFWEPARSPQDALTCMKEMFGIPETSSAPEILAEIGKVQSWFSAGSAPLGTDPEYFTKSLRTILNLPTLTPSDEVLQTALTSVQKLAEDQAVVAGVTMPSQSTTVPTVPEVAASRRNTETNMNPDLLKLLAPLLCVRQSDDAVVDAVRELVTLRNGLKELFGGTQDGGHFLLERAKKAGGTEAKLRAIAAALGIEDPDAAVEAVKAKVQDAKKLLEVMPELDALKKKVEKQDEAQAETDVDMAIAASKGAIPASMRSSLLLHRKHDPEGFSKAYPKQPASTAPAAPAPAAHLLQPSIHASAGQSAGAAPAQAPATLNLSAYPGLNRIARAKAYLSTVTPSWDQLTNEQQCDRASALCKTPGVIDEPAAQAATN